MDVSLMPRGQSQNCTKMCDCLKATMVIAENKGKYQIDADSLRPNKIED